MRLSALSLSLYFEDRVQCFHVEQMTARRPLQLQLTLPYVVYSSSAILLLAKVGFDFLICSLDLADVDGAVLHNISVYTVRYDCGTHCHFQS